ncbi:cysteine proteinase [Mytilinidion resinicola]|uniref:Cysteine proteinase n=1 Tax=Mytilinidion resinicola TaxID=574789 RepID=A0A6A6XZ31_9PEZI|nr:cysteine proteinase [Mytilinidion resinicola]KAF2801762.1 cysteine proteinase [Mytilinidion resinicola]
MSFIAKGFNAAVGSLFAPSTAPEGHKNTEASPEESNAGSPGSPHEHPHTHRVNHRNTYQVPSSPAVPVRQSNPINSAASELRRAGNRRRESKSDLEDEKRLTGNYTTPADAVIIALPNATALMKHKPITGGHRPMNTMTGPMISNIQVSPRPAQRTYGNKSVRLPVHDLDEDPIYDDEQISPRKRRKTIHASSRSAPIHIREDDRSPPATRQPRRPVEKPKHSRNTIWNDPLGKSEFLQVDEMVNSHSSKRHDRRTSLTSSEGKLGRPTAAQPTSGAPVRIELSDDDDLNGSHSPIHRHKHVTDELSAAPKSPIGRRTAKHVEGPERTSPCFSNTNGAKLAHSPSGGAHNTHTDFKAFIHTDPQRHKTKEQRTPHQRLSGQFRRYESTPDDEISIQHGMSSGHRRNDLNKRPSEIPSTTARSRAQQRRGQRKKPECRLMYFATHAKALRGPNVSLIYSRDEDCYYVRDLVSESSTHEAVSRVEHIKATRVFECAELKSLRLTGPRSGLQVLWYDLQFEDEEQYFIFLQSMPDIGVKRVQKSSTEMIKIFRNPLDQGVPPPKDEEIALLEANKERRAGESSHHHETSESKPPRKRLSTALKSQVAEDNTAKKPRIDGAEGKFNKMEVSPRPPSSYQRKTRGSLYANSTDAFRDLSPSRPDHGVLEKDRYSVNPGLGPRWEKPVEYPLVGRRRATVPYDDLEKLDDGEFLNDALIEFYMLWAYEQAKLPSGQVHLFNTYFYETLSKKQKGVTGVNYKGVARWVKDDIFSYDYVVVPVNEETHWYVAIICNLPNIEGVKTMATSADDSARPEIIQVEGEDPREPSDVEIQTNGTASNYPEACSRTDGHTTQNGTAISTPSEEVDPDLFAEEQTANGKALCESGEWPDPEENRESQSVTPFRETSAAVQRLSLKDGPPGGNVESPSLKSNMGSVKSKKKWPGPRKYDPDQPVIIILDSLDITHARAVRNLKDYIQEEGKAKRNLDAQITSAMNVKDIPKQSNFYDCGVFVLLYLKAFFQKPREFVTKILTREMNLEDDWVGASASDIRAEIRNILFDLHKEQDAARKKQRAEKKKSKKESPEKKVLLKEKKPDKPDKPPEPQTVAEASPSPAKRPESPEDDVPKRENTDLRDAPVPSIEGRSFTPTSPALPSRAQDLEVTPDNAIEDRDTKLGSTIPESPPIPERSSRLGSEAAPIEIEDSQPTISHRTVQQQANDEHESADLWTQLKSASAKEPSISITSPRSRRKRRTFDVDKDSKASFD